MRARILVMVAAWVAWSLTLACAQNAYENYFEVLTGEWSDCLRVNESTQCYRRRDTACVRRKDNVTASWYYCEEIQLPRPTREELCPPQDCLQDCAVTAWSKWTLCNCEKSHLRSRYREIVTPPRNGGAPCPPLVQNSTCSCELGSLLTLPRNHTWSLGEWGLCRPFNDSDPSLCGHGVENRSVLCVDRRGRTVNTERCLAEAAFAHLLPPPSSRLCRRECPCVMSEWTPFSGCQPVCSAPAPHSVQRRTRRPIYGDCDRAQTTEVRPCEHHTLSCPSYAWQPSPWSDCVMPPEDTCGMGLQWRNVFCLETFNGSQRAAYDGHCSQSAAPDTVMPCNVACPRDCVASEWSPWSECPPVYNESEASYSNRTRVELVSAVGSGRPCPHLSEWRRCPKRPLASWSPGPFPSRCNLQGDQECGIGEMSRNLFCVGPAGELLDHIDCRKLPQPRRSIECYVPCPTDCVLSSWSEWSPCSEPCGHLSGQRTRSRHFVAYGETCIFTTANLTEVEACSSAEPCSQPVYSISAGEWSECIAMGDNNQRPAADGLCNVTGRGSRTSVCLRDGVEIPAEECPISFQPQQQRNCSLPCTSDCVMSQWSSWSTCKGTCGAAFRTQLRYVLKHSAHGGAPCPLVGPGGVQLRKEKCELECPAVVEWGAGEWSPCQSKLSSAGMPCGRGFQTRQLLCVEQESRQVVDIEYCYGLPEPLATVRPCAVSCAQHCFLTAWSDFSPCTAGQMTRSRNIIPFTGSSDWTENCPELTDVQLEENVSCSETNSHLYGWFGGYPIDKCIFPSANATCGKGKRYRHVICKDAERSVVSEAFCKNKPWTYEDCSVPCTTNCQLSQWSPWSQCSATCGYGTQERSRDVIDDVREGGRPCGPLYEMTVCRLAPCQAVEYRLVSSGQCVLNNASSLCGEGEKPQNYACFVDGEQQKNNSRCFQLAPPDSSSMPCHLPCPGECVLSEWGPWEACMDSSTQYRSREILREGTRCPDYSGLSQNQPCEEEPAVSWRLGAWTNCTLDASSLTHYCGSGVQRRAVECIYLHSNETIQDGLCSPQPHPPDTRPCTVPCPLDCRVGPFSPWSECPNRCAANLLQRREREVLVEPANGGRPCPTLTQEMPCPPTNCMDYVIEDYRSSCLPEITVETSCGAAVSVLPLSCRLGHTYLPLASCSDAVLRGDNVEGRELLSPAGPCPLSCPSEPDCVLSGWQGWSECQRLCQETESFSFRTRHLLREFEDTVLACSQLQHEAQPCNASANASSTCLDFEWRQSPRGLVCVSNRGQQVEGGCSLATRPTEPPECVEEQCADFSACRAGRCLCDSGFEEVGGVCLPLVGCALDAHCLYPQTVCKNSSCMCREGTIRRDGVCEPQPTSPPTSPSTGDTPSPHTNNPPTSPHTPHSPSPDLSPSIRPTVSMETASSEQPSRSPTETAPGSATPASPSPSPSAGIGLFTIILISTIPLLVVIVMAVLIILVTYRCRRRLEGKSQRSVQELKISHPVPIQCPNGGRPGAAPGVICEASAPGIELCKYNNMNGSPYLEESSRSMEDVDIDEALDTPEHGFSPPLSPSLPYPHHPPATYSIHTDPHHPSYPLPPPPPPHFSDRDDFHVPYMPGAYPHHPPSLSSPPSPLPTTDDDDSSMMRGGVMRGGILYSEPESELSQGSSRYTASLVGERYASPYGATSPHPFSLPSNQPAPEPLHHAPPRERLRTGMDATMVRVIEELGAGEGSQSPSLSSVSSRSGRRGGRRRRSPGAQHNSPQLNPSPAAQFPYGDYNPQNHTHYPQSAGTYHQQSHDPESDSTPYNSSSFPRQQRYTPLPLANGGSTPLPLANGGPASYNPGPYNTGSLPRHSYRSMQHHPPPPPPHLAKPTLLSPPHPSPPMSPNHETLSVPPRSPPTGQRHVRFEQPSPLATHSYSFPDTAAPPPPPPPPPLPVHH